LPPVATVASVGSADAPINVLVSIPRNDNATTDALVNFVGNQSGLTFEGRITSGGEALSALCSGRPTLAFVDGWTLLLAQARNCATPILRIQRDGESALSADLIASSEARLTTVAAFRNQIYCRISAEDDLTWKLPLLAMQQADLDPLTELQAVRPVPDLQRLVTEVARAQCVGAIESGTLARYQVSGIAEITNAVRVVGTTISLPYGGLVANQGVPVNVVEDMARSLPDNRDAWNRLLEADQLRPAQASDYQAASSVLSALGY
jgi:ABC transporter, phosphonate, periplasmic substrate-binding protein